MKVILAFVLAITLVVPINNSALGKKASPESNTTSQCQLDTKNSTLIEQVLINSMHKLITRTVAMQYENCKFLEEQFTGMLFPYIQEAIKSYYGENRAFMDAKLLELKKSGQGQYTFTAKVQVTTFVGAHNPPYGIETITIIKDLGKIYVSNFVHENK